MNLACGIDAPNSDNTVISRSSHLQSVRRKHRLLKMDTRYVPLVKLLALRDIPETHAVIEKRPGGDQLFPIWRNRHAIDRTIMSLKDFDLTSRFGIPQAQRKIDVRRRDNSLAVGRPCSADHQ